MIADVFTKIVTGSQDRRLAVRFYYDCNLTLFIEKAENGKIDDIIS
jgi:hypothetical protein